MHRDRHLHIFHNDPVSFNAILSKALQLLEEVHGSHFAREAVIEIRVEDLLLLLCRTVYDKVNPSSRKAASRLHEQVMAYIDENLEEDISLDSLAERFFVSKYHISHTFKEHLGISVHQYLLRKRLAACRDVPAFSGLSARRTGCRPRNTGRPSLSRNCSRIKHDRNFCNIYNNPVNSIFWLGLVIYIQQRKEQIKTAKTYS